MMRQVTRLTILAALVPAVWVCSTAPAAIVYSEDFDTDHTANWKVNNGPSDEAHNFFFDYSTVGIPSAPNSTGGTTRGMKLQCNLSNGIFSGMSVSPLNLNLQGDYKLEFDYWGNANGPMPAGGSGSTNLSTFGVQTSGTFANWPGLADCVWFGVTAEGNSSADWRAYSPAAAASYQDGNAVYSPALTRNASDPWYNIFGGATPPAAQTALFSQQTGTTQVGAPGFTWQHVTITKTGTVVEWIMGGRVLAHVDTSAMTLGGNNIMFGHSDINAGSSADPNDAALLFTLIDNITVDGFLPGPTITVQPQHQTKIVDEMAVFTVAAKSNLPNQPAVHIEWFQTLNSTTTSLGAGTVTGPDVNGVFTSQLVFPSVSYSQTGTKIYAVLTDDRPPPANPTTSNTVFLTVLPLPTNDPFADADGDHDVDQVDFGILQACITAPANLQSSPFDVAHCGRFDHDKDGDVDEADVSAFVSCADTSGPGIMADPACDDFASGKVIINELAYDIFTIAGVDSTDNREFIELYNPGDAPVDISGWLLRASDTVAPAPGPTGDDNPDYTITGGPGSGATVLQPHAFYVLGSPGTTNLNQNIGTVDLFENANEAIQLIDANGKVIDTLIYELNAGPVAIGTTEGGYWGNYGYMLGSNLTLSRYVDGRDTGDNGRDFGILPETPGASNSGALPVINAYVPPDVEAGSPGTPVAGLVGSFVNPVIIDPQDATLTNGVDDYNPSVIPNSPQGGKCIVAWDPSGGGNATYSTALVSGDGSYDLYVYFDTADITIAGAESTSYGIMGSTDPFYNFPDPDANFLGDIVTSNGNTGLAWIFNKNNAGQNKKLFLVDAGHGGDSSAGATTPINWNVIQTVDMSAVPSGWHRLSLAYTGATGAVVAKFDAQTFNFVAAPGLIGQFYIGYRESLAATPASLRPPTFDRVAP